VEAQAKSIKFFNWLKKFVQLQYMKFATYLSHSEKSSIWSKACWRNTKACF